MNEILPPQGIRRTPKISAKRFWMIYILGLIVVIPIAIFICWDTYTEYLGFYWSIGITLLMLVFVIIYAWAISQAQYSKIVLAVQQINKDEITMRELKTNMRLPLAGEWNTKYLVKRAVKKGYLPDYKYLKNERLLVRINTSYNENAFLA